jgi:hypothetical protein
MPSLAAVAYDPATAVVRPTTALLAMTAFDTTNLRLTFVVPTSGRVLVQMSGTFHGATTYPQFLVGVMSGATVVSRIGPMCSLGGTALATTFLDWHAEWFVPGLTPGASLTWDAAYSVETLVNTAGSGIKYGGPNDATANNAFGALTFAVLDV